MARKESLFLKVRVSLTRHGLNGYNRNKSGLEIICLHCIWRRVYGIWTPLLSPPRKLFFQFKVDPPKNLHPKLQGEKSPKTHIKSSAGYPSKFHRWLNYQKKWAGLIRKNLKLAKSRSKSDFTVLKWKSCWALVIHRIFFE